MSFLLTCGKVKATNTMTAPLSLSTLAILQPAGSRAGRRGMLRGLGL